MSYTVPDFSTPLDDDELKRLETYCINAGTFLADRYRYSEKAVRDFYRFKRHIPELVSVVSDTGESTEFPLIESVVSELKGRDALRDEANCFLLAESMLLFKGKSVKRVRNSLRYRGFGDDMVDAAILKIQNFNVSHEQESLRRAAYNLVKKSSFKKKSAQKRRQYFVSSLVGKGFSVDDIFDLVRDEDFSDYLSDEN